jgi:hypothetical protein
MEAWENIVRENAERSNSYEYFNYFRNLREFYRLIGEHYYVETALLKLRYKVDKPLVMELRRRGYNISLRSSKEYAKSLQQALSQASNLKTKIKIKENELTMHPKGGNAKQMSFEEIMAQLIDLLKVNVDDTLTLARYNAYKKQIKEKARQQQRAAMSRNGRTIHYR